MMMKKLLYPLLLFLEISALGSVTIFYYLMIHTVEPVHWLVMTRNAQVENSVILLCQVLFAIIAVFLFRSKNTGLVKNIARGAWPLVLLYGLLFAPPGYWSLIAFTWIVTIAVFLAVRRCGLVLPGMETHGKMMAWISGAAGLAGAAYGMYLQFYGVYHLSLIFSDWSVYVLAYMDMASSFLSAPWKFFNAGGHFNLLPNCVGALLYSMTDEPFAIFVLNSLVIYSAVPCTYFAARSSGLAPLHALIFALGLLMHFSLANLNLCTFYGYHPNIYLLPLFLLFWGFFVRKKYGTAAVFMLLSLMVQETFAVLWFGFGLVLLFFFPPKKMRLSGAALSIAMVGWFFFVTRVLMSWGNAENAAGYQQMFHYSNLGNSIPQILLSPFYRPSVFFNELLAVENFYFALFLLAGFCTSLFYARLMLMLLPPFIGVCLLNNTELSNVAMQYQVEFFVVLAAAAAMGLVKCGNLSRETLSAALTATLCAMLLCGIFAGRFPWSLYSGMMAEKDSCREKAEHLKKLIPPGAKLQTTLNWQAHFIGRNPLLDFADHKIHPDAEYALLPQRDLFLDADALQKIFRLFAASDDWKVAPFDPISERVLLLVRVKK